MAESYIGGPAPDFVHVQNSKIDQTLRRISRLYELVEEMRTEVGHLREAGVEVRIRSDGGMMHDPLGSFAALTITLRPGCEVQPK